MTSEDRQGPESDRVELGRNKTRPNPIEWCLLTLASIAVSCLLLPFTSPPEKPRAERRAMKELSIIARMPQFGWAALRERDSVLRSTLIQGDVFTTHHLLHIVHSGDSTIYPEFTAALGNGARVPSFHLLWPDTLRSIRQILGWLERDTIIVAEWPDSLLRPGARSIRDQLGLLRSGTCSLTIIGVDTDRRTGTLVGRFVEVGRRVFPLGDNGSMVRVVQLRPSGQLRFRLRRAALHRFPMSWLSGSIPGALLFDPLSNPTRWLPSTRLLAPTLMDMEPAAARLEVQEAFNSRSSALKIGRYGVPERLTILVVPIVMLCLQLLVVWWAREGAPPLHSTGLAHWIPKPAHTLTIGLIGWLLPLIGFVSIAYRSGFIFEDSPTHWHGEGGCASSLAGWAIAGCFESIFLAGWILFSRVERARMGAIGGVGRAHSPSGLARLVALRRAVVNLAVTLPLLVVWDGLTLFIDRSGSGFGLPDSIYWAGFWAILVLILLLSGFVPIVPWIRARLAARRRRA